VWRLTTAEKRDWRSKHTATDRRQIKSSEVTTGSDRHNTTKSKCGGETPVIMLISTALLLDSNIRNSVCTPAKLPCRRVLDRVYVRLVLTILVLTGSNMMSSPPTPIPDLTALDFNVWGHVFTHCGAPLYLYYLFIIYLRPQNQLLYSCGHGILDIKFMSIQEMSM
jgi:hypothetical protein